MKKITYSLFVLAALCLGAQSGWSQEKTGEEKKKIVIIKKTIDENGEETTEKIIREGDAAEDFEWTDEDGNVIRIEREGPEVHVRIDEEGQDLKVLELEGMENLHEKLEEELKDLHIEHRNIGEGQYFFFKDGEDGPVFEWNGEGEMPEEIRRKLAEEGLTWEGRPEELAQPEKRPFLGVMVGLTEEVENIDGVETRRKSSDEPGLEVLEIMEGSAAEAAGLQVGDIVTAIDGQVVNTPEELIKVVGSHAPGEEITIDYRRDGQAGQVRATLGEQAFAPRMKTIEVDEIREGDGPQQFFYFKDGDEDGEHKIRQRVIIIRKDGDAQVEIHEENPSLTRPEAPAADVTGRRLEPAAFDVFPNPTGGQLTVKFQADPGPTVFTITDVLGREIHRQELDDFDGRYDQQIDVRAAAKGTLLLTIRQGDLTFTEKVLLK